MKKKNLLLSLIFGMLAFVNFGCSSPEVCEPFDACGKTAQACCTDDDCHYEYNGKDYNCNGTECTNAAKLLVNDMCDFKSGIISNKEISIEALKLIENVKINSLCN